jgi:hypothetical protein
VSRLQAAEINRIGQAYIASNPGATQVQAAQHALFVLNARLNRQRWQAGLQIQKWDAVMAHGDARAPDTSAIKQFRSLNSPNLSDNPRMMAVAMYSRYMALKRQAESLMKDAIEKLRPKGALGIRIDKPLMEDMVR